MFQAMICAPCYKRIVLTDKMTIPSGCEHQRKQDVNIVNLEFFVGISGVVAFVQCRLKAFCVAP